MAAIGIGIISFAHAHVVSYCRELSGWSDVRLVRAWDDNQDRGRRQSEEFGLRFTPDLDELLADPRIEAVIIASETVKHGDHVAAAARAGKSILLQKPMALTVSECDRIVDEVDRSGVHCEMAWQMRCDPVNMRMKQMIEDGFVGRVGTIRRRHCLNLLFNTAFLEGESRWHIDRELNRGMWMDDACHAADFLLWFLGKPRSVMAEIDNTLTDVAPDDTGMAIYRFPGREFGLLYNSSVTPAAEITTEIYGDGGAIQHYFGDGVATPFARPESTALKYYRRGDAPVWQEIAVPIPEKHGERIAAVPRPWIDRLLAGRPPDCDVRSGRASALMTLAAYESAERGERIVFGENYAAL